MMNMDKNKSKKNIILITIDCLRADHLGCLGYAKNTTPYIDSLADRSILFTQSFSTAPYTNASMASLLTGTYPLYKGNVFIRDRTTIAEMLKDCGYSTAALHSNAQLTLYADYKKGFNIFDDIYNASKIDNGIKGRMDVFAQKLQSRIWNKFKSNHQIEQTLNKILYYTKKNVQCPYSPAAEISEKAVLFLKTTSSPFFLWLHYMDAHYPYHPSEESFSQISKSKYDLSKGVYLYLKAIDNFYPISPVERKYLIDMYDASIHMVDSAIRELIENLELMGMLDNTYIILTADHGDEFWDHGHFGHEGHPDKIRSAKLHDEMLHVPLIIFGTKINGAIDNTAVSLVNLVPTIVDMSNIRINNSFVRTSLMHNNCVTNKNLSIFPIIAEATEPGDPIDYKINPNSLEVYSYRIKNWKYIHYTSTNRTDELYDIITDPKETLNVINSHPDIAQELKSKIITHVKSKNRKPSMSITGNKIKKLKEAGKI